ncbi:hypothetical protein GOP47_0003606 [Adiantum capillus-veneris]|uniref:K-box domain-containing protein n=1 Tax=Adiantum capillus-veneris TaxID=13818 RepID=A0A9D4ZLU2_ADICA|nr:hypothetical protein GOP47_0003606 [Adiantum capillus-veneris]
MQNVLERYKKACNHSDNNNMQHVGSSDRVTLFMDEVKNLQSTLIGDNLERLSSRDLIRLEQQIHESLGHIRAKKEELFYVQLQEIKDEITATPREVNVSSNVLETMVEFASSELTGTGRPDAIAPQTDASLLTQRALDTIRAEMSTQAADEGGVAVAQCPRMTEDLNKSPACCDK